MTPAPTPADTAGSSAIAPTFALPTPGESMSFTPELVAELEQMAEREAAARLVKHRRAVLEDAERLRVRAEAKALIDAEKGAALVMPTGVALDAFLERDLGRQEFAVDRVWPSGGNVLCAAQRKAGKTTLSHNLIRSLVDGSPFLDEFSVPKRRRVALLDFELSEPLLQKWMGRQGIQNMKDVQLYSLKGQEKTFNILDDRIRAWWAKELAGNDVLILDPLRPILAALGLNEWNETGPLLQAFDQLKKEAGISEGLIHQHHGHHAERAAGDSRLEGWADALWNLTRDDPKDPRSFRFFDAYGRDVDVDKGLLSMYGEQGHLAFAADATLIAEAKSASVIDQVIEVLRARGATSKVDLLKAGIRGLSEKNFTSTMSTAESTGFVAVTTGDYNRKTYSLP